MLEACQHFEWYIVSLRIELRSCSGFSSRGFTVTKERVREGEGEVAYAPNCEQERARAINTAVKRAIISVPLLRTSKSEGGGDKGLGAIMQAGASRAHCSRLKKVPKPYTRNSFVMIKSAVNRI